ncbi:MAG: hypothetical protein ABW022_20220 [Actinoplanes sp.]
MTKIKLSDTMESTLAWIANGERGIGGSDRRATYDALAKRGLIVIGTSTGLVQRITYTLTTTGIAWLESQTDRNYPITPEVRAAAAMLDVDARMAEIDATLAHGEEILAAIEASETTPDAATRWGIAYNDGRTPLQVAEQAIAAGTRYGVFYPGEALAALVDWAHGQAITMTAPVITDARSVHVDGWNTTPHAPGFLVDETGATGPRGDVHTRGPLRPGNGSSMHWRRTIRGVAYSFTLIVMPDGEIRWGAQRYNGYRSAPVGGATREATIASSMRFGCAWQPVHFGRIRPAAPMSTDLVPVTGPRPVTDTFTPAAGCRCAVCVDTRGESTTPDAVTRWGTIVNDGRTDTDLMVRAIDYADATALTETDGWYAACVRHVVDQTYTEALAMVNTAAQTLIKAWDRIVADQRTPFEHFRVARSRAEQAHWEEGGDWHAVAVAYVRDRAHAIACDMDVASRWGVIVNDGRVTRAVLDQATDHAHRSHYSGVDWYRMAIRYVVGAAHEDALLRDQWVKIMSEMVADRPRVTGDMVNAALDATGGTPAEITPERLRALLDHVVGEAHAQAWTDYHNAVLAWRHVRIDGRIFSTDIARAEDAARARWTRTGGGGGPSWSVWYEAARQHVRDTAHALALDIEHHAGAVMAFTAGARRFRAETEWEWQVSYHGTDVDGVWCRWSRVTVRQGVTECPSRCKAATIVRVSVTTSRSA